MGGPEEQLCQALDALAVRSIEQVEVGAPSDYRVNTMEVTSAT